jgi:hypothetical protein
VNASECILYSGAGGGAEAAFGSAAERWNVEEVNFTFEGHPDARQRGIRVLTQAELKHGDVSLTYVSRLMNRTYKDSRLFKMVLQTIWHQVNSGQEIYVVGKILDDQTVKGGTGWGAEFAKLCNKPLFVYDQERNGWFGWQGTEFVAIAEPIIQHHQFCGTGTRFLSDEGAAAIDGLFQRSFGTPAAG